MMTALVMRPPRFGGKVASFDATKAKAVAGVVEVVQIPRGVAVVAQRHVVGEEGPRGAQASPGTRRAAEKRGTAQIMKEYQALARAKEAVTVTQEGDADAALAHARAHRRG